jgi:SAM-dependent methyltransferase
MNRVAEPYLKVSDLVNGFGPARVVHVSVELDVFTRLANEGKSAAQLSILLEVDPRSLELLLNALTALGLLRKEAERFYDTPVSHTYLSRTGPKYIGNLVKHLARRWEDWGKLEQALRTGAPVHRTDHFQDDPAELEFLVRGMHELAIARGDARYLSRAVPLGRCRKLLDLGGGPGTYAAMFCHANRKLEAVVMDLPATLKVTRRILREFDRTGRVTTLPGDYRTDKIKGAPYDVILVSNILHAESEETNRDLMQRIREALVPGGILVIKDHVMGDDHTTPPNGALFALQMMLVSAGRTYSFAEISGWLQAAGFEDMVEIPVEPPMNVSLVFALRPGKRPLAMLPKPAARVGEATLRLADALAHDLESDASEGDEDDELPSRVTPKTARRHPGPSAPKRARLAPAGSSPSQAARRRSAAPPRGRSTNR